MKSKILSIACAGMLMMSVATTSFAAVQTATSSGPTTAPATSAQLTSDVFLTIQGGDITIGSQDSGFDMGSVTVSSVDTTTSNIFNATTGDYFFVDDLKGVDDGYYTTIQMSDFTQGGWGAGVIPGDNLTIRTTATNPLDTIAGATNPLVNLGTVDGTYRSFGTTPLTFISRNAWLPNNGLIGRYGMYADFELTVPAYTPVGTYQGTLTYTLYEN